MAPSHHDVAGPQVGPRGMEVAAGSVGLGHHDLVAVLLHLFDHDHAVGALRQYAAREDAGGGTVFQGAREGPAGGRLPHHPQPSAAVRRADGVAVDSARREARQLAAGHNVGCGHPPRGCFQQHLFRLEDRRPVQDQARRLLRGQHRVGAGSHAGISSKVKRARSLSSAATTGAASSSTISTLPADRKLS